MKHQLTFETEKKASTACYKLTLLGLRYEQSGNTITISTDEPFDKDEQDFLVEALAPTSQQFNVEEVEA